MFAPESLPVDGRLGDLARRFRNRREAGHLLAQRLKSLASPDLIVAGLPRGGIVVAYEVARELGASLDTVVVRKVGHPSQPEYAIGAVAEDGVLESDLRQTGLIQDSTLQRLAQREADRAVRLAASLREGGSAESFEGKTVLLVDDGLATGHTMRAAIGRARRLGAERVIVAVPVASPEGLSAVRPLADEVVSLVTPSLFQAVGQFYDDFEPVEEDEARDLLGGPRVAVIESHSIQVPVESGFLEGEVTLPSSPIGMAVFAHGSGSGRLSPRNRKVASVLHEGGIATLLYDLLMPDEASHPPHRFDIAFLAQRAQAGIDLAGRYGLPVALIGSSTGLAAAIRAAVQRSDRVQAVVGRGGRPDLAGDAIEAVQCPTLLIVGSNDFGALEINHRAYQRLRCEKKLVVIRGASHLFEEEGTLVEAAAVAQRWLMGQFAV